MDVLDRDFLKGDFSYGNSWLPHDMVKSDGVLFRLISDPFFTKLRLFYRKFSYSVGLKKSPFFLYGTEGVVFVHIPKNAGTFINGIVYPSLPSEVSTRINAHHSVRYLSRLNSREFFGTHKFVILRHPASRLRSAFEYLKFDTPFESDRAFAAAALDRYSSFDEFCDSVEDSDFERLIEWPHFQPQCFFFCADDGRIMVDSLVALESLSIGLSVVGSAVGKSWQVTAQASKGVGENPRLSNLIDKYYREDLLLWNMVQTSAEKCVFLSPY